MVTNLKYDGLTLLPSGEPVIEIDLNTRTIDSAAISALNKFHHVQGDILSETMFFVCDRYYDNQDLSANIPAKEGTPANIVAIDISYINAADEAFHTPISHEVIDKSLNTKPHFYKNFNVYNTAFTGNIVKDSEGNIDIEPNEDGNKLIIKWALSADATRSSGKLKFAISFTKISEKKEDEAKPIVLYQLNTKTATLQIYSTVSAFESEGYTYTTEYQLLMQKIGNIDPSAYYTRHDVDAQPIKDSNNLLTSGTIFNILESFSPTIELDDEVTKDSENGVKSSGIYKALENLSPTITLDNKITRDSENGVTSKAIWSELGGVYNDLTVMNKGRKEDTTIGLGSDALGSATIASGYFSFASGRGTSATNFAAHAEGVSTIASGEYGAHAEGQNTTASGTSSHAEGDSTTAAGRYAHAEGNGTNALKDWSHAEGQNTTASGDQSSHAEGTNTTSSGGHGSHAEGDRTTASGISSHAEGGSSTATASWSHAEGYNTNANTQYAHAEGNETKVISSSTSDGKGGHAEGWGTTVSGQAAHAEGWGTTASGAYSHVEGSSSNATGFAAHAGGTSASAGGHSAFAHGDHVKTDSDSQVAFGQYNDSTNTRFSIGNGTSNNRSNAFWVDNDNNTHTAGYFYDKDGKVGSGSAISVDELDYDIENNLITIIYSDKTTVNFTPEYNDDGVMVKVTKNN